MAFHATVFDQLLLSLRQLDFDDIVSKHHTGAKPRKFDHWSQLVSMVFCKFTGASLIRDLMRNLNARKKMHYHWRAKSLKWLMGLVLFSLIAVNLSFMSQFILHMVPHSDQVTWSTVMAGNFELLATLKFKLLQILNNVN